VASPAATGNKLKRRSSLSDFSPKSSSNKEGAEQEWLSLVDGKVWNSRLTAGLKATPPCAQPTPGAHPPGHLAALRSQSTSG